MKKTNEIEINSKVIGLFLGMILLISALPIPIVSSGCDCRTDNNDEKNIEKSINDISQREIEGQIKNQNNKLLSLQKALLLKKNVYKNKDRDKNPDIGTKIRSTEPTSKIMYPDGEYLEYGIYHGNNIPVEIVGISHAWAGTQGGSDFEIDTGSLNGSIPLSSSGGSTSDSIGGTTSANYVFSNYGCYRDSSASGSTNAEFQIDATNDGITFSMMIAYDSFEISAYNGEGCGCLGEGDSNSGVIRGGFLYESSPDDWLSARFNMILPIIIIQDGYLWLDSESFLENIFDGYYTQSEISAEIFVINTDTQASGYLFQQTLQYPGYDNDYIGIVPVSPGEYELRFEFTPDTRSMAGVQCAGSIMENGSGSQTFEASILYSPVDLDVDSDNTNNEPDYEPDRDEDEEAIEHNSDYPGRYVFLNDDDDDEDGIIDYLDGYNAHPHNPDDDINSDEDDFVRMIVEIPEEFVRGDYHSRLQIYKYGSSSQNFRIWKKNGNEIRTADDILLDFTDPSTYMQSLSYFGFEPGQTILDLWVEAKDSPGSKTTICINFCPCYWNGWCHGGGEGDQRKPEPIIDEVYVKPIANHEVDLDIDSDNNDGCNAPEQSQYEDEIEDIQGDPSFPGKLIWVNTDDSDSDGIPDFADGFNWDNIAGNDDDICTGEQFTPMILEVQLPLDGPFSFEDVNIRIEYDDSNPASVTGEGTYPQYIYTPGSGHLRIWKINGDQNRVMANVKDGGDYISADEYQSVDLGSWDYVANSFVETYSQTVYVEGIAPSEQIADQRIKVEIDPDGDGGVLPYTNSDAIRITLLEIDLDVDSDNTNNEPDYGPDRDEFEDRIEACNDTIGRIVFLNNDDDDQDNILDFVDGFNPNPAGEDDDSNDHEDDFVRMVFEVPQGLDFNNATINISYCASNPSEIEEPFDIPAEGCLRIWIKNGFESRDNRSILDGGDFVEPDVFYNTSDLDLSESNRIVDLWIEGITNGQTSITFLVDPDGPNENITCSSGSSSCQCPLDVVKVFVVDPVFMLNAPYRGPIPYWRNACLNMHYGDVVNIVNTTTFDTNDEVTFKGDWDQEVIRLYQDLDASGSEIIPDDTIIIGEYGLRFSAKAIAVRNETERVFPVILKDESGTVSIYVFIVQPVDMGIDFMPSTPLLDVVAGAANMLIPAGVKVGDIGRSYCRLQSEEVYGDGSEIFYTLYAQIPGTMLWSWIPHVDQFDGQGGISHPPGPYYKPTFGTPWNGVLDPGWRFSYDANGESVVLIAPDGTVFEYMHDSDIHLDDEWEISKVWLPGRSSSIDIVLTKEGSVVTDLEIIDAGSGGSIQVSYGDESSDTLVEVLDDSSSFRKWHISSDDDGHISGIEPVDVSSGQILPGARYYMIDSKGRIELIKKSGDISLYKYIYNVDGGLDTVRVNINGYTSPIVSYTENSEDYDFGGMHITKTLEYDGEQFESITINGHTTNYVWDVDNSHGNVGLIRVTPPPEDHSSARVVEYDYLSDSEPFLTGITDGSMKTYDVTLDQNVMYNILPVVTESRTPNADVTTYEYDLFTAYENRCIVRVPLLRTVTGPNISSGPQPPNPSFTEYIYYSDGQLQQIKKANDDGFSIKEFEYDNARRLTKIITDPGDLNIVQQILGYSIDESSYTVDGLPKVLEDARGFRIMYDYFGDGRLETVTRFKNPYQTSGDAEVTNFFYNDDGQLWYVDEPDDDGNTRRTMFTYNPIGWLIRETVGLASGLDDIMVDQQLSTRYHYSNLGNLIKVTGSDGKYVKRLYNNRGLLEYVVPGYGSSLDSDDDPTYLSGCYSSGTDYWEERMSYYYYNNGELKSEISSDDVSVFYEYDHPDGLLSQVIRSRTYPDDYYRTCTLYNYNENGQINETKIEEYVGASKEFLGKTITLYNENGQVYLEAVCSDEGCTESNLASESLNQTEITEYVYNRDGLLKRKLNKGHDPDSDEANRDIGTGVPEPGDAYVDYVYDAAGRPDIITPWLNPETETEQVEMILTDFIYDDNNNVIQVTRGDRIFSWQYDFLNRKTHVSDPAGAEQTFDYHRFGPKRVVAYDTIARGDDALLQTRAKFDVFGRVECEAVMRDASAPIEEEISAATALISTYNYRDDGRLDSIIDVQDHSTAFSYDDALRIMRITDPAGNYFEQQLDDDGRFYQTVMQEVNGDPIGLLKLIERREYNDETGFLKRIRFAGQYGPNPSEPSEDIWIDTVFDRNGIAAPTRITYDDVATGFKQSIFGPQSINDDQGGLNRITKKSMVRGDTTSITADPKFEPVPGLPVSKQHTQFRVDPRGLMKTIFEDSGNITASVNMYGELFEYKDQRDVVIRVDTKYNVGDGHVVTMTASQQPGDVFLGKQRYIYDGLGRLVVAEVFSDFPSELESSVEFIYDDLGRLEYERQIILDHDSQSYETFEVGHTYRDSGVLESVIYPSGEVVTFDDFDMLERPQLVLLNDSPFATLGYTGFRLTKQLLHHGVVESSLSNVILNLSLSYDNYGRLNGLDWSDFSGFRSFDFFHTSLDKRGNPLWLRAKSFNVNDLSGFPNIEYTLFRSQNYDIDAFDRLSSLEQGQLSFGGNPEIISGTHRAVYDFDLDHLGNKRYSMIWNYEYAEGNPTYYYYGEFNDVNELTMLKYDIDGTGGNDPVNYLSYKYDHGGYRRSQKYMISGSPDHPSYYYVYGGWGQLIDVYDLGTAEVDEDGNIISGWLGDHLISYDYDALGRRIKEERYQENNVTVFLYDGLQVIEERDYNSIQFGKQLKRYFWGTMYVDQLWALDVFDSDSGLLSDRYFTIHDLSYNVVALVKHSDDFGSQVVERYVYSPYGLRKIFVNNYIDTVNLGEESYFKADDSSVGNQIGFQGLRHDGISNLIFARNRYLDPFTGAWLSRDPLGYVDGMNLYESFGSNPVRFRDPLGTDFFEYINSAIAYSIESLSVSYQGMKDVAYWEQTGIGLNMHNPLDRAKMDNYYGLMAMGYVLRFELDILTSTIPGINDGRDLFGVVTGYDPLATMPEDVKLTGFERFLFGVGVVVGSGPWFRRVYKAIRSSKMSGIFGSWFRHGDDAIDLSQMSGICFTAGTQVKMADGEYENIEDIQLGDRVFPTGMGNLTENENESVQEVFNDIYIDDGDVADKVHNEQLVDSSVIIFIDESGEILAIDIPLDLAESIPSIGIDELDSLMFLSWLDKHPELVEIYMIADDV